MMTQIPILGSYKTALLLTDDELHIFKMSGKGTERAGSVAWDESQFIDKVLAIIKKKCGNRPVIVLNDMSEQFYKVDKLPDVKNPLDRNSMIKNKVKAAFPQYKITGAIFQSDRLKGQKATSARVIMAAIPLSQKIQRLNNILNYSGCHILGVGLLPIESASMADALSQSLNKNRDKSKNSWTVFIAQNSNGGLRQIVIKNGQMALTRMTPIVNTDSEPEVWASEVAQELKATMTYLTRFDYKQDENLEVIVVTNPTAGQILEGLIDVSCNFYSLTVYQAAERLGIKLEDPEEARFIDPLHARWAANKLSFDMDMKPQEVEKIANARLGAIAASLLMFCSLGYFTFTTSTGYINYTKTEQEISEAKALRAQAEEKLAEARKNKEGYEYDITLVEGATKAYEGYEKLGIKPTEHLKKINTAARRHGVTFSAVTMEFEGVDNDNRLGSRRPSSNEQPILGEVVISLEMVFPGSVAPEKGNSLVQKLAATLGQEFKDDQYTVEVTKYLRDMTFESQFSGTAGLRAKDQRVNANFKAEIEISGKIS